MSDDDKKLLELEREFRGAVISDLKSVKNSQNSLETKVENLNKRLDLQVQKFSYDLEKLISIDKTLIKNTEQLEIHIKRSNQHEEMLSPMYQEYLSRKAVDNYKEKRKKELMYNLRLPVAIVSAVAAIGVIIAWLVGKV